MTLLEITETVYEISRTIIYAARTSRGSSSHRSISAAHAGPQQQTCRPPLLIIIIIIIYLFIFYATQAAR